MNTELLALLAVAAVCLTIGFGAWRFVAGLGQINAAHLDEIDSRAVTLDESQHSISQLPPSLLHSPPLGPERRRPAIERTEIRRDERAATARYLAQQARDRGEE